MRPLTLFAAPHPIQSGSATGVILQGITLARSALANFRVELPDHPGQVGLRLQPKLGPQSASACSSTRRFLRIKVIAVSRRGQAYLEDVKTALKPRSNFQKKGASPNRGQSMRYVASGDGARGGCDAHPGATRRARS